MRFRVVEDQGSTQANKNTKTKRDFIRLATHKGLSIVLPKGTVVHHKDDTKQADCTKSNEWNNVIIIPSIDKNSSYAEMVHRIITNYQKVSSATSIKDFFSDILRLPIYAYDEHQDRIITSTVQDTMKR